MSEPRNMPGSGAMGSSLGIWEFLSPTNSYADFVPQNGKYKFVDDLSTLEIINLLNIGLASFNCKAQVPNDISVHGQYVPGENLQSQQYLEKLDSWATEKKMIISEKKTKAMIFNFTGKYQFSTRLSFKGQHIEIVDKMKILGCHINNQLTWDDNCDNIIKQVNNRMQLLRKVWGFCSTVPEMVHLQQAYCRSVLEQSCVVWHSTLTEQNSDDLERTQKAFVKLILQNNQDTYENSLLKVDLTKLSDRRKMLTLQFEKRGLKNGNLTDLFPEKQKLHNMSTRKPEKFQVMKCNNERLKKSSIVYIQTNLNQDDYKSEQRKRKRVA